MPAVPEIAGTISALNITPVVAALAPLGIDADAVLARAGTTTALLAAPHARVPASLEFAVWDAIREQCDDPLIGLRVAEQVQVGALGGYEYLLRNSPNMRAAIEQANRFERIMDDHTRVAIIETGADEAALRVWREGGLPHPPRGTECLFAGIARMVRQLWPDVQVLEMRFAHEAPCEVSRFRAKLGCPVRFAQPHNEIAFPRALLDRPLDSADPVLSAVLEEHLTHVLETLPTGDPFIHAARAALGEGLQGAEVSLDDLARRLHLSARTLRRRLAEHGTSYRALLDELRRELARYHVAHSEASFEWVAQRLGFTDVSAFYRAFKRWTGTTPAAYRAAPN